MTGPNLESAVVDVGGVKTRYWTAGDGEPLVLVHGGGAGADAYGNWSVCGPRLAEQFRIYAVDMLGFGQTLLTDAADAEYTQDARNAHLEGFLDALDLASAHLIGNSMGGGTSLGVAMHAPDRVRRLVLMGSAGLSKGPPSPSLRRIADYVQPDLDGMRAIVDALTNPSYAAAEDLVRYRYELTLDDRVMAAYKATQSWIKDVGGLFYDEDEIAKVEVPTLIVQGREDAVVDVTLGHSFNRLLQNSWLYVLPNCGHWAMIEHPNDFVSITSRFLTMELG